MISYSCFEAGLELNNSALPLAPYYFVSFICNTFLYPAEILFLVAAFIFPDERSKQLKVTHKIVFDSIYRSYLAFGALLVLLWLAILYIWIIYFSVSIKHGTLSFSKVAMAVLKL